jgi:organic hydroperoxide reductase OsmC/OhrA
VVIFVDAVNVKIREGQVANRPIYLALGVTAHGERERTEVGDVSIDSRVSLLPTAERGFSLAVELDMTLPQVRDPGQAARLVAAAHHVCPYSNAARATSTSR